MAVIRTRCLVLATSDVYQSRPQGVFAFVVAHLETRLQRRRGHSDAVRGPAIAGKDEMDSRPRPRIMTKSHGPAFGLLVPWEEKREDSSTLQPGCSRTGGRRA